MVISQVWLIPDYNEGSENSNLTALTQTTGSVGSESIYNSLTSNYSETILLYSGGEGSEIYFQVDVVAIEGKYT